MTPEDGIYHDVPYVEYSSWDATRATAIKAGRKSMLHMWQATVGEYQVASPAMNLGTFIHKAILEPKLATSVAVRPLVYPGKGGEEKPWNNNATYCKEWNAEREGELIVTKDDLVKLTNIVESVNKHPEARMLIADSQHEVGMVWSDRAYGRGKARVDMLAPSFCADLKTTADVSLRAVQSQFTKLGYYIQFGWQQEGLRALGETSRTFYEVVVETAPPWDVGVFEIEGDALHLGREEAVKIAKAYNVARLTDSYTGVTGGQILRLDVPDYMKEEKEEWEVKT